MQSGIVLDLDAHPVLFLQTVEHGATLFVEEHGERGVGADLNPALLRALADLVDLALDLVGKRIEREHLAGTLAVRTLLGEEVHEAGSHALAAHFDETEIAHGKRL